MRLSNILLNALLVLPVLGAVGCNSLTPSLTMNDTEISAEGTGGKYEVGYTMEDIPFSADGWSAQYDAEWIAGCDFSTDGVIVVDVQPNNLQEERSAVITFSYSGIEGEYQVNVNQKAGSIDMADIILEKDELMVSDEGGEYTVKYTIKNPIVGISVRVEANVPWISSVRCNVEGEVTFKTSWNFAGLRETEITLVYGDKIERSFKVIQQEGDPDAAFDLLVGDVTQSTAIIEVVPKDSEMYYTILSWGTDSIEEDYGSPEGYIQDWLNGMNMVAGFLGMSLEDVLRKDMFRGEKQVMLTRLAGGTEISAYVFGMEPSDQSLLTKIFEERFVTEEVPMLDVTFDIEADVQGAIVNLSVTPSDPELMYFVNIEEKATYSPQAAIDYYLFLYSVMGKTTEEAIAEMCVVGDNTTEWLLDPNTDYVAYACTINEEVLINCELALLEFTTGDVLMSDNKIELTVKDVTGTSATIDVSTSNNDFYVVAVGSPKLFSGLTDDEAVDAYIASNLMYCDMMMTRGDKEQVMPDLVPNTEYVAFAFGYYRYSDGYVRTSSPVKVNFTTTSEAGNVSLKAPVAEKKGIKALDTEDMRKRYEMERYLRMLGR